MRTLNQNELEVILAECKALPERDVTRILDEFEREQPAIYQAIFAELSDGIAEVNQDMSDLFLDLSFDVIWVFLKAFGKPHALSNGTEWVTSKMALLDAELKSLAFDEQMNKTIRNTLQERFVKRSLDTAVQMALLEYLGKQVVHYASVKRDRLPAMQLTTNLLFVLIRLMGDLYSIKCQDKLGR
jgi:hypothetical protein